MSEKYYSSDEVLKRMHAQVRRITKKQKDMKIAVVSGGASEEREVALASGRAVYEVLKGEGFIVELIEIEKDITAVLRKKWDRFDVVFSVLHGHFGEDGAVQGMFELMKVPYVGSKVLGSAACMDKSFTKLLFTLLSIPTARWAYVPHLEGVRPDLVVENWSGPAVVKPIRSGSSIGITFCEDVSELLRLLPGLVKKHKGVIVEEPIKGRELTCAVIDSINPIALPVVEIMPQTRDFFDYKAKYTKGETEYQAPARITGGQFEKISEYSLRFFRALKLSTYARFDLFLDEAGKPVFLECNTLPGLTATSLVPMAAKAFGLEYPELIKFLVFDTLRLQGYL